MDFIDDLLAQVKAEYDQPDVQQPQQKIQKEKFEQRAQSTSPIDSLLAQVKADYQQHDQAEELERQQQFQEEQRKQKQIKQQEFEAVKIKAIVWLKKLDPLSSEGIWFENFAKKYSSKLAAAIDYIQSV
ncbi:MAG: hypothetical protein KME05_09155 [Gloeocapsa sp. UFS-A4-WI-NPMV-4B04]|jgi:hypothetical protein|nr:hypothetical protein [Gloeocapsa sp. UFS-A4-WI-NPMV-4B04]